MRKVLLGLWVPLLLAAQRPVTDATILIDTHNDVPLRTVRGFDIGVQDGRGHTSIPRLREGGVGAVFFAVYVAPSYAKSGGAARHALEVIDSVRRDIVAAHPNDFMLAASADEIEQAHKQGKIAALMGVEGGHAIEDSLRVLRTFYDLGARYLTLTHSNTNNWADSSGDVARHNGLTKFGREVIVEMNRLGMIVDVSHVSDKTFWDVLETSAAPVLATHSNCRALSNIPRNMTDEMIAAIARKGGQVNLNFGCEFLSQKSADASRWINPKLPKGTPMPRATVADVVAHIDRVVKLAGVGHVGIGTDFDGIGCTPEGLDDPGKFPNLTRALLEHGYTPADIQKIYGGNMLRLMRAVEQAAAKGR
jgi:membrane dipeptidase